MPLGLIGDDDETTYDARDGNAYGVSGTLVAGTARVYEGTQLASVMPKAPTVGVWVIPVIKNQTGKAFLWVAKKTEVAGAGGALAVLLAGLKGATYPGSYTFVTKDDPRVALGMPHPALQTKIGREVHVAMVAGAPPPAPPAKPPAKRPLGWGLPGVRIPTAKEAEEARKRAQKEEKRKQMLRASALREAAAKNRAAEEAAQKAMDAARKAQQAQQEAQAKVATGDPGAGAAVAQAERKAVVAQEAAGEARAAQVKAGEAQRDAAQVDAELEQAQAELAQAEAEEAAAAEQPPAEDADSTSVLQPLKGKLGCFIATAAYGSPFMAEVEALRDFRDERLIPNPVGRFLTDVYYAVSPPVAEMVARSRRLRAVVRRLLNPLVQHFQP